MIGINERFENLDPEKQSLILNVAMEEFASEGYEQSSTNTIVKNARIGKGMLFYYFGNKKGLFNYLLEYAIDFVNNEYILKIDDSDRDIFSRYKNAAMLKLAIYKSNPYVFNFLGRFFISDEEHISADVYEKVKNVRDVGFAKIYSDIDTSLFRKDMDPDAVFRLITLTFTGYETTLTNQLSDIDLSAVDMAPYWEDFDNLLEEMRKVYYE